MDKSDSFHLRMECSNTVEASKEAKRIVAKVLDEGNAPDQITQSTVNDQNAQSSTKERDRE